MPIYVTRGEGQRLDNAHSLHGQLGGGGVGRAGHAASGGALPCLLTPPPVTLYDCAVGHPDCSHCQAANGSLGCLWCSHGQPACRYGPLCPPGAVEPLCPTPRIETVSP